MSFVDGTTSELRCGTHGFVTTNLDEWHRHLREPGHYAVGSLNCVVCGEEFAFTTEDKVPAWSALKGLVMHPGCRGGA